MSDPLTGSCDVLWVARFDYLAGQSVSIHEHDYWQVLLPLTGHGQCLAKGGAQLLAAGQLFLFQPGSPHGLQAETAVETLDCKFQLHGDLATACADLAVGHAVDPAVYRADLERVLRRAEDGRAMLRERCGLAVQDLLLRLLAAAPQAADRLDPEAMLAASDAVVAAVVAVIRERYAEALDGEALVAATGYSYRHLAARCRAVLGRTPRQLLRAWRIDRACALLRYSDYPVKAVAGLAGFTTVHHFTRCFAAEMGVGPAAWRQQAAGDGGVVVRPGFANIDRVVSRSHSSASG